MKFSCEKALLLGAVSTASRAVAVKSSIPALEGILIEAGEQLRLTGYNLETGIRAAVPAEIREKGSLVLSARLFGEIIRKMPDDVVVFTSENYMVNIKCGLSEFNILGTDPEEFPELPSVEEQNGLTIGQPPGGAPLLLRGAWLRPQRGGKDLRRGGCCLRGPGGPAHPVPGGGHGAGLPPAGGGVPGL